MLQVRESGSHVRTSGESAGTGSDITAVVRLFHGFESSEFAVGLFSECSDNAVRDADCFHSTVAIEGVSLQFVDEMDVFATVPKAGSRIEPIAHFFVGMEEAVFRATGARIDGVRFLAWCYYEQGMSLRDVESFLKGFYQDAPNFATLRRYMTERLRWKTRDSHDAGRWVSQAARNHSLANHRGAVVLEKAGQVFSILEQLPGHVNAVSVDAFAWRFDLDGYLRARSFQKKMSLFFAALGFVSSEHELRTWFSRNIFRDWAVSAHVAADAINALLDHFVSVPNGEGVRITHASVNRYRKSLPLSGSRDTSETT